MCLSCGCGEYQRRHKPSDITLDDLATAAKGRWMEIGEASANLQDAGRAIKRESERQESQKAPV